MKITLDRDDIKALIIAHVKSIGIKCNHVAWDGYSFSRAAEVTFIEPDTDEHESLRAAA